MLRAAGYKTGLIGKWGMMGSDVAETDIQTDSGNPFLQGFDEFFGYLTHEAAHNYYPPFLWRGDKNGLRRENLPGNANGGHKSYSGDLFFAEAQEWVKTHKTEPFFLFLTPTTPHFQLEPPDLGVYGDENWPLPQKKYASMISRLDASIGALLDTLREQKLAENTLVITSSDHGPSSEGGANPAFFDSTAGLRGHKRDLYEGGLRVPAIAWQPGTIAPATSDFPWFFPDFLPTAAELAGVAAPTNSDGISILPTLNGQKQAPHAFFYWENNEGTFKQAARSGDWKVVRMRPGAPLELYNLQNDNGEQQNVAAQNPDVVAKFEAFLKTARTESELFPPVGRSY